MNSMESSEAADVRKDTSVTIVMVTLNRREETLRSLTELRKMERRFPIVVVDNGSTDGTSEAVRTHHPDVLVYESRENLGSAGRTIGVKLASTPYIAFADDDSWWERGSLTKACELLDHHPELGMVCAKILVYEENRLDEICTLMANSLDPVDGLPGVPITGFLACAAVVRRETYLDVGGFQPHMGIGGEESLFAIDVWASGRRIHYVGSIVAHHWPSKVSSSRSGRRRRGFRNDLWTLWLRRPARTVARDTREMLRLSLRDADRRGALRDALKELPWVIKHRRPVPQSLEDMLETSRVANEQFSAGTLDIRRPA